MVYIIISTFINPFHFCPAMSNTITFTCINILHAFSPFSSRNQHFLIQPEKFEFEMLWNAIKNIFRDIMIPIKVIEVPHLVDVDPGDDDAVDNDTGDVFPVILTLVMFSCPGSSIPDLCHWVTSIFEFWHKEFLLRLETLQTFDQGDKNTKKTNKKERGKKYNTKMQRRKKKKYKKNEKNMRF